MDIATLLGFVVGFALILVSIMLEGTIGAFINAPGLTVVGGGTLCAAMVAEKMPNVINGIKVGLNAIFLKSPNTENTINTLVELSTLVRKDGVLALENAAVDDAFMERGVRFAVDGMPYDEVKTVLEAELMTMKRRHKRGQKLFRFLADTAPAMGMVGTLIGLVQMLQALDDPSAIGPAMAVALLTTLYGAIFAFMVFGPLATKLEHRSSEETLNMLLIITGLESVLKGENARVTREKLDSFLASGARKPAEA